MDKSMTNLRKVCMYLFKYMQLLVVLFWALVKFCRVFFFCIWVSEYSTVLSPFSPSLPPYKTGIERPCCRIALHVAIAGISLGLEIHCYKAGPLLSRWILRGLAEM